MQRSLLLVSLVALLSVPAASSWTADQNMELVSQTTGVYATALAVCDRTVAVNYPARAGYGRLRFYDVTNPAAPVSKGDSAFLVTTSGPMCFDNQKLYMAGLVDPGIGVLMIIDMSGAAEPTLVAARIFWEDWRWGLAVSNDLVYVWITSALSVFDATDPTSFVLLGSCPTSFSSYSAKIVLSPDRAYVSWPNDTNNESRLLVFDTANPTSPTLLGTCSIAKSHDFDVTGNAVCLLENGQVFRTLDFSDPANPVQTSSFDLTGGVVRVTNGLAYVLGTVSSVKMLWVVDVSNATSPKLRGSLALPNVSICDFAAVGKYAYLAAGDAGLLIVRYTGADVSSAKCWDGY